MAQSELYPRYAAPRLMEALDDAPVVLIHGPRQCGKTTLASAVGDARGYEYVTFDDDVARAAAEAAAVRRRTGGSRVHAQFTDGTSILGSDVDADLYRSVSAAFGKVLRSQRMNRARHHMLRRHEPRAQLNPVCGVRTTLARHGC